GLCLLASAAPGQAQTPPATPTTPMPPPAGTPPSSGSTPPAVAPAPGIPPSAVGHALSLEEAIAIALQTQPLIQARLSDYLAAAHRVDQAFAPLLPQLTGSWTVARTQSAQQSSGLRVGPGGVIVSGVPRTVTTIKEPDENTQAVVSLSQVLFDFGKTFASTDAARRLAEQAQEDVEL